MFTQPNSLTTVLSDGFPSICANSEQSSTPGKATVRGVALNRSRGDFNHSRCVKAPGAAEQHGSACARGMRPERGGAALLWVCLQSCQRRSPGQKSFYLLKQMLYRTKCQADFKGRRCAEPWAAIAWQRLQPSLLLTESFPEIQAPFSPHAPHCL